MKATQISQGPYEGRIYNNIIKGIEHVISLIANGALSSQMIYIINTNLCWGSIIWWIACLIIELFLCRKTAMV
jgi:hypothetical protein